MSLRDYTLVEVFGEQKDHRCGYCKSGDTNQSYGMWAHFLSVQDYENLLNRGWRRSGKYLYKPTNHLTCCPAYTINCHALEFQLAKSQKKILKKFNNYLLADKSQSPDSSIDMKTTSSTVLHPKSDHGASENISSTIPSGFQDPQAIHPQDVTFSSVEESDEKKLPTKKVSDHPEEHSRSHQSKTSKSHQISLSVNPTVMQTNSGGGGGVKVLRKAREIRLERKKQKLLQKGIDPSTVLMKKQSAESESKTIEDLILTANPNAKRKFVIKTVRVDAKEFEDTFELEYNLYRKYQVIIHDDEEKDCTKKQFKRFLCDSPLVSRSSDIHAIHGSYHQQYYIDDELVAVGVIDILPSCLSSVYFFYDPDYKNLSLGNYGALREIAYVRQIHIQHHDIRYYYMGFYIHSCVKMRYKGNYSPSYLLCPEKFTFHLLDDKLRAKLTASKYSRLNEDPNAKAENVNFKYVTVLHEGHRVPYFVYRRLNNGKQDEDIQKYANLVGDVCARSIVAYLESLKSSDD